ncbi:MAG: hypothetical protein DPW15_06925 [Chloroflexi bacterium]|nr:hypothetical protein [Chloroflexota bacterium]
MIARRPATSPRAAGFILFKEQNRKIGQVTVIGGPECAHEGTWWEVRTEYGDAGWMREFTDDGYFLK